MKRLCPIILAVIIFWAPMLTTCSASSSTENGALEVRVLETPTIDTALSGAAVIISLSALLATVCLQIKHNRDEVRPILAIHLDSINMSIKIQNHGVGPAILMSMEWKNTETNQSADTLSGLLGETLYELKFAVPPRGNTKPFHNDPNDPDALAPQEDHFFIDGSNKNTYIMSPEEKRTLGQLFRGVTVTITYTDLYKSQTWTLTKDLSWLARATA